MYLGTMQKMKIAFVVLLVSWIQSSLAQEISEKQQAFVQKFIVAVESHSIPKVLKLTDETYRKEQLTFLKGRKEQFVDELFGGTDQGTNDWINVKFQEIQRIEVAEVSAMENGDFEYIFRIRDGEHDILNSLLLTKSKKKFGFVGATG